MDSEKYMRSQAIQFAFNTFYNKTFKVKESQERGSRVPDRPIFLAKDFEQLFHSIDDSTETVNNELESFDNQPVSEQLELEALGVTANLDNSENSDKDDNIHTTLSNSSFNSPSKNEQIKELRPIRKRSARAVPAKCYNVGQMFKEQERNFQSKCKSKSLPKKQSKPSHSSKSGDSASSKTNLPRSNKGAHGKSKLDKSYHFSINSDQVQQKPAKQQKRANTNKDKNNDMLPPSLLETILASGYGAFDSIDHLPNLTQSANEQYPYLSTLNIFPPTPRFNPTPSTNLPEFQPFTSFASRLL